MAEAIVAELRPRLQACSIFITSENSPLSSKIMKISIKSSSIDITWSSSSSSCRIQRITLPGCKLVPNTLSCLQAKDEFVSFRVQTEPLTGLHGSFTREILPMTTMQSDERSACGSTEPNILAGSSCLFSCVCCGHDLANYHIQRVLPLPSGSLDSSEWFCHGHGSVSFTPDPHPGDLLYGPCYFVLKKEWLHPNALFSSTTNVVRCKRCLAWLGTTVSSGVTLWNCTVSVANSNTNPLQDFIKSVVRAIASCVGLACRVVVQTQLTERETQYLLLWVIDKNLQILTNSEPRGDNEDETNTVIETELKSRNTVKLLYLHQSNCSMAVKAWLDDVNVQCIDVAKPMFTEGLEHLRKMTKCIPHPYRITNNYFTAYLEI